MREVLLIATALLGSAHTFSSVAAQPSSSVLQSLPAEVQKQIEDVRAACREYLIDQNKDPNQSWMSSTAHRVESVSSGDDGLIQFTVSGALAVMVSDLELCGGQCLRGGGGNCSNHGGYFITIYIRSKNAWREALSTNAVGGSLLSADWSKDPAAFKAIVLSILGGNKGCPSRPKQECHVIVKWDGTKFTYKPL